MFAFIGAMAAHSRASWEREKALWSSYSVGGRVSLVLCYILAFVKLLSALTLLTLALYSIHKLALLFYPIAAVVGILIYVCLDKREEMAIGFSTVFGYLKTACQSSLSWIGGLWNQLFPDRNVSPHHEIDTTAIVDASDALSSTTIAMGEPGGFTSLANRPNNATLGCHYYSNDEGKAEDPDFTQP